MTSKVRSDRWRGWVVLALGVWLFLSPWILGFAAAAPGAGAEVAGGFTAAAWNAWILGVVVAAFALWAALQSAAWPNWASGVLGAWLALALDPRLCGCHGRALEPRSGWRVDRGTRGLGSLGGASSARAADRVSRAGAGQSRL